MGIGLRPDRSNLTAAFEWATANARRVEAAELIAGGYAAFVLDGGGLEAATLIERAIEGCTAHDAELTDALRVALTHCLVWLNEWSTIGRIAASLVLSTVPPLRAFGFIVTALVTGFSDVEAAQDQLIRAQAEVDAVMAPSPSLTADIVAGYVPWIGARIAATAGDYESAFRGAEAWLAVQKATDFYSTGAARATKHAAVCQILLGQPAAALRTIGWLDQFDFVGANTDDIEALGQIALGDIAQAESYVRVHAARAITGRLIGEVCDSVVLLASLAHAEGDDDIARALLLQMGMGQEPATITYSTHLAAKLGITVEHAARQRLAIAYDTTSTEGPSGSRMAMMAVRNELRRRGWSKPTHTARIRDHRILAGAGRTRRRSKPHTSPPRTRTPAHRKKTPNSTSRVDRASSHTPRPARATVADRGLTGILGMYSVRPPDDAVCGRGRVVVPLAACSVGGRAFRSEEVGAQDADATRAWGTPPLAPL